MIKRNKILNNNKLNIKNEILKLEKKLKNIFKNKNNKINKIKLEK